jgi:hypothetical protein
MPMLYLITPTYKRPEQIPDLTRLAQTLMHVPSITWLIIEDAEALSSHVTEILKRSGIRYVHLIGEQQRASFLLSFSPSTCSLTFPIFLFLCPLSRER